MGTAPCLQKVAKGNNTINHPLVPVKLPFPMLKKILHEPLTHFFLAGALVFFLYSLLGPEAASERQVLIDEAVIERLKSGWRLRSNREPTAVELDGLLADHLYEELFSREARALGLEYGDPVIRRRLTQKMALLSESAAQQVEPGDAKLLAWYEAHPELYRTEPRLGFKHIYFNHDRPDGRAVHDAKALLSHLEGAAATAGGPELGDNFMLPHEFTDIGLSQLDRLFGEDFATSLLALETGSWQGPALSGYGYHLVYLYRIQDAEALPFDESRPRVLQDWQRHRIEQAEKDLLEELTSRYEITYTKEARLLLDAE